MWVHLTITTQSRVLLRIPTVFPFNPSLHLSISAQNQEPYFYKKSATLCKRMTKAKPSHEVKSACQPPRLAHVLRFDECKGNHFFQNTCHFFQYLYLIFIITKKSATQAVRSDSGFYIIHENVICICEIPNICGYIFSNTDNTDLRDISLMLVIRIRLFRVFRGL